MQSVRKSMTISKLSTTSKRRDESKQQRGNQSLLLNINERSRELSRYEHRLQLQRLNDPKVVIKFQQYPVRQRPPQYTPRPFHFVLPPDRPPPRKRMSLSQWVYGTIHFTQYVSQPAPAHVQVQAFSQSTQLPSVKAPIPALRQSLWPALPSNAQLSKRTLQAHKLWQERTMKDRQKQFLKLLEKIERGDFQHTKATLEEFPQFFKYKNKKGDTALHKAVVSPSLALFLFVLKNSPLDTPNLKGQTPLDVSFRRGKKLTVLYLVKHGHQPKSIYELGEGKAKLSFILSQLKDLRLKWWNKPEWPQILRAQFGQLPDLQ